MSSDAKPGGKRAIRAIPFTRSRVFACALVLGGCSASHVRYDDTDHADEIAVDGGSVSFEDGDVSFVPSCNSFTTRLRTVWLPAELRVGQTPLTLQVTGSNAFSFADESRTQVFSARDRRGSVDVLFDPSKDSGVLEGALSADDGVTRASVPIHASASHLQIALEQIDTLPLLLNEPSAIYHLEVRNVDEKEAFVHIDGAQSYMLSKNDFYLASETSETVVVSAMMSSPVDPIPAFLPTIKTAGCSAIAPSSTSVSATWPYEGLTARASALDVAVVASGGAYSTDDIDFGNVDCGTTAPPKALELRNLSHAAIDVSLALAKGGTSPYVLSESAVHLPPRSRHAFTLTSASVPQHPTSAAPDSLFDSLAIRSRLPEVDLPILQHAWGHRFSFVPAIVQLGEVATGGSSQRTASIRDDGYVPVSADGFLGGLAGLVGFSAQDQLSGPFGSSSGTILVKPAQDNPFELTFHPTSTGAYSGTITFGAGYVSCAPPAVLQVSGTGI